MSLASLRSSSVSALLPRTLLRELLPANIIKIDLAQARPREVVVVLLLCFSASSCLVYLHLYDVSVPRRNAWDYMYCTSLFCTPTFNAAVPLALVILMARFAQRSVAIHGGFTPFGSSAVSVSLHRCSRRHVSTSYAPSTVTTSGWCLVVSCNSAHNATPDLPSRM